MSKVIAVVGATGAQGGGLARAILDDPRSGVTARAITRRPDSESARALAARGAEVIAADLDDEESLVRAFAGADAAFCVTNYWEHFSPERELAQGRALASAAKRSGVRHAIWSTLEDTRHRVPLDDPRMPTLMEKYKVPHFDTKGQTDGVFGELGVPTTCLRTSFYWENLIGFGLGPKKGPDGRYAITFPLADKAMPCIAVEDIGRCAYGIFTRGEEFIGQTVGIAGEHLTGTQMAAQLSQALGVAVAYNAVTPEVYRSFGFPGADDLGNMFQYKRDFDEAYRTARDPAFARSINPALQDFKMWLAANASRIPL
jgi:uncharacterized protein YbjT (DUF2867 family)